MKNQNRAERDRNRDLQNARSEDFEKNNAHQIKMLEMFSFKRDKDPRPSGDEDFQQLKNPKNSTDKKSTNDSPVYSDPFLIITSISAFITVFAVIFQLLMMIGFNLRKKDDEKYNSKY